MWNVIQIEEGDFGCEERMPGEPLMVIVTIENDFGQRCEFECADEWLRFQDINEGDEWPEDIDIIDKDVEHANKMSQWMENYYEALEELDDSMN